MDLENSESGDRKRCEKLFNVTSYKRRQVLLQQYLPSLITCYIEQLLAALPVAALGIFQVHIVVDVVSKHTEPRE